MSIRFFWCGAMCLLGLLLGGCGGAAPRVLLVGDSTLADYGPAQAPQMGWGQALRLNAGGRFQVLNFGVPGSSSLSFYNTRWPAVLRSLQQNDLLLVQFGHNDSRPEATHHALPEGAYTDLLRRYVLEARRAGARPVLVTPVPRHLFEGGQWVPSEVAYAQAMRALAATLQVPLVDLAQLGAKAMSQQHPSIVRSWYMLATNGHDNVHLTQLGATAVATLVMSELLRLEVFVF